MYEDSDPNLGIYDMRVELPADAPRALHKVLNNNICNKGGGGQTQQTTSGIDPEFKPYLETVLSDVTKKYKSDRKKGADAVVAKLTPEQKAAMEAQKATAQAMMQGTGMYDTRAAEQRSLQDLQGTALGQASMGGSLGSARSQAAMQGALAGRAGEYQRERQTAARAGEEMLGGIGSAKQQYQQARLDAPHTMASRYFGYLQNAPQQQTTTSSGGGK